jgi:hypothetical protein
MGWRLPSFSIPLTINLSRLWGRYSELSRHNSLRTRCTPPGLLLPPMEIPVGQSTISAAGCVLVGNPNYYGRFGFRSEPALVLPGVPPEYFQAISFGTEIPTGIVTHHEAFDAQC